MMKKMSLLAALLVLLGLAGIIYSQQKEKGKTMGDFHTEWQQVDSLSQQGLPRSALEVLEKIYRTAKKEGNSVQMLKVLMYRTRLQSTFEEDALLKQIRELEKEIAGSDFPMKPVLQSMLAESYWSYFQGNMYKILDRTQTAGFDQKDISTWDAKKFLETTIALYQASLTDSDRLKSTSLKEFDPILVAQPGSRTFRPTLYDLLAHRAVDFFMNDQSYLTRPAEQFHMRGEEVFLPAAQFTDAKFTTPDSLALKFYALRLLQDLLTFHLTDDGPDALVDVDLKRLKFARENSVHQLKDSLYVRALEELEQNHLKFPISTWVSYEIAAYYFEQSAAYQPGLPENPQNQARKWERKKAYQLCEEAIKRFPDSEGAQNCRALQAQIAQKSLSIAVEKINLPEQPFRALVKYQNVGTVYLRIVPTSPEEIKKLEQEQRYDTERWIKYYLNRPAAKEWSLSLPDDGDYHSHAVEIKMPELPAGYYAILLGTTADFSMEGQAAALGNTWISRLGYAQKFEADGQSGFYVFDRDRGNPLPGVTAQLWIETYDKSLRKAVEVQSDRYTSDQNGYFRIGELPKDLRYGRYRIDFRTKNDRLFPEDHFSAGPRYPRVQEERSVERTFFFTDRSIYRPGQTLHFKGILLRSKGKTNEVVSRRQTTVTLYDANNQKVADLILTTNEYGTFSGTFTLPSGGLTGVMYLRNESGSAAISMEEYKRPKFEVTFSPVTGSFRLDDTVTVKGAAKAYAGSVIDNGAVQYRVVRKTIFPYDWWGWWRWPGWHSEEVEIANGVTRSDEKGEFSIDFVAIADPAIPKAQLPVFHYTVYADVTDLGGETRSAQTVAQVGYVALAADMEMPETLNREALPDIKLSTQNLNGEFEPAGGTIFIYALKDPGRIFRNRLWEKPDRFILSKEEYYRAFPQDVYDNEDDFRTWERGAQVMEYRFDTGREKSFTLEKLAARPQGRYAAELITKDKFGEEIKVLKFFSLYSLKEKAVPAHALSWHAPVKAGGEPGETAHFSWGSAAPEVHALLEIYRPGEAVESRWIRTGQNKNDLKIPITENERGNFSFSIFFVKYGRAQSTSELVRVPWSNKDLKITYETFRDKLKPGQPEEWKLKISGPKGEKVAAEMLAAMYDASLDAFKYHGWQFDIYPYAAAPSRGRMESRSAFSHNTFSASGKEWNRYLSFLYRNYDQLDWSAGYGYFGYVMEGRGGGRGGAMPRMGVQTFAPGAPAEDADYAKAAAPAPAEEEVSFLAAEPSTGEGAGRPEVGQPPAGAFEGVQVRANLNETAFFYPHLETNAEGEIILSFTMPEALTRWKFLGFSHTQDLQFALTENSVVTQKELMVMPNLPRFFREGDRITVTGKVSNLSDNDLSGSAVLQLFDALTMQPVDAQFGNAAPTVNFSVKAGQSAPLAWNLAIPEGVQAVACRMIAKTENFSDGEENILPVLTNRMLVTESLPLPLRGAQSKTFRMEKLLQSGQSKTLRHQRLTLEFTSNPAWYAIQALPYMMEFPYECSEQIFSRYYANSIAAHLVNSSPKIKRVFDSWKREDTGALLSNLEKNQELKALLLEETPWVLQAQSESERKNRLALLFDLNKMAAELQSALRKLQQMQAESGGWPWFPEMPESRYVTGHIVAGLGHLDRLGVKEMREDEAVMEMVRKATLYLDEQMNEDYQNLLKNKQKLDQQQIGYTQIQYLYARSFFLEIPLEEAHQAAFDYWKNQAAKYWLPQNIYMQGMIALALHRMDDGETAGKIIKSLKEKALHSEEMGMYWRDNAGGYYWYQAPIETQALLIELFEEVASDRPAVEDMKAWLLKQKQTQDWETTKATAEACYALLLRGSEWLESEQLVEISVGGRKIDPAQMEDVKVEAGTGYFKTAWPGAEITPEMGSVAVSKKDAGVAWGALYWQYFEQLDKITPQETPLKLQKQVFLQENSPTGPLLKPVTEKTALKPGDLLKVRIELRSDRDMEYLHLKDMRAAGLEPLNVLSRCQYQGGLVYYESTRDAATNFFFSWLPKGTYVFEYPLRVTHAGDFSNGITSIQCMYAPEFSAHSEGIRLSVGGK
ncbi:MAG: hypothetical protein HUU32_02750 [Calditrichaceae bacterium]|nr:MG2 domain-containing protein [Calditrichia bacterium]NUQ40297.1 hypothetical protein [Calditrichaceae bacterium]